jgi:hypothetical protein
MGWTSDRANVAGEQFSKNCFFSPVMLLAVPVAVDYPWNVSRFALLFCIFSLP